MRTAILLWQKRFAWNRMSEQRPMSKAKLRLLPLLLTWRTFFLSWDVTPQLLNVLKLEQLKSAFVLR